MLAIILAHLLHVLLIMCHVHLFGTKTHIPNLCTHLSIKALPRKDLNLYSLLILSFPQSFEM